MKYLEIDHIKGKDVVVEEIYEKLLSALHKFGAIRIEQKKQVSILLTDSVLQGFIREAITSILKFT